MIAADVQVEKRASDAGVAPEKRQRIRKLHLETVRVDVVHVHIQRIEIIRRACTRFGGESRGCVQIAITLLRLHDVSNQHVVAIPRASKITKQKGLTSGIRSLKCRALKSTEAGAPDQIVFIKVQVPIYTVVVTRLAFKSQGCNS